MGTQIWFQSEARGSQGGIPFTPLHQGPAAGTLPDKFYKSSIMSAFCEQGGSISNLLLLTEEVISQGMGPLNFMGKMVALSCSDAHKHINDFKCTSCRRHTDTNTQSCQHLFLPAATTLVVHKWGSEVFFFFSRSVADVSTVWRNPVKSALKKRVNYCPCYTGMFCA